MSTETKTLSDARRGAPSSLLDAGDVEARSTAGSGAASGVAVCVERLEEILAEAATLNAELLECVKAEREALRTANTMELAGRLRQERDLVDRIDSLEQRRKVVTATLATTLQLDTSGLPGEVRLSDLAARLGEPDASRLLALGRKLRAVIEAVKKEGGIVRESCEALLSHVCGLMQKVQMELSQTKTYGRDGRIGPAAAALCGGLDLHS